ncbi:hypothetical protein B0H14DRAFT_2665165 [Mycena olivaceomarginata]|nr:hypothetical protein B0H14DRAFT_2665165 [Mycena olivaceomarginata]
MQALNAPTQPADVLFLERLDTFCLAEIKAFAEREQRPFDETRKYVAEWHSKYLFQTPASGVQSFLLAVDPSDPTGSGFLGGSLLGREFWRGQRGGGDAGAKAFKLHCFKSGARTPAPSTAEASSSKPAPPPAIPKIAPARTLKADLYDGVRKALRSASGVRNAEMKWTNPALWLPTNPSSLKANQNKELLEALESGTMHFVRTITTRNEPQVDPPPEPSPSAAEEDNSFSWAIQYDDSPVRFSLSKPSAVLILIRPRATVGLSRTLLFLCGTLDLDL